MIDAVADGGARGASVSRTVADGTAMTIISAPRTARSMSPVTVRPGGSRWPGR